MTPVETRFFRLVVISSLLVGCRHPVEMRGLYVTDDGKGAFFPCDRAKTLLHVSDSALATSYRRMATTPYQLLFVRLRGVRVDSGSIYYSSHYLLVQQILEIRARQDGECPSGVTPILPMFLPSRHPELQQRFKKHTPPISYIRADGLPPKPVRLTGAAKEG